MTDDDQFVLRLPAEPGNVSVIREAIGSHAGEFGLEETVIADLKTVVSEACANVVLHAYPPDAQERPLEVEMGKTERAVSVVIRDKGGGIRPLSQPKPPSLRLGLQLIGAIAGCFQIRSGRGRGTELAIELPLAADA
jgi:serine/threonine-protein kinase RsbW